MKQQKNEKRERNDSGRARFGAADVVIILLIVLAVASIILRSVSDSAIFGSETARCMVEFSAEDIRYTTFDFIETGADVYVGDDLIGRLAAGTVFSPSILHTNGADGAPTDVHYPENTLIDISGTVECELIKTDGGYVTKSGTHIAPGCTLTFKMKTVDLLVTVTGISYAPQSDITH